MTEKRNFKKLFLSILALCVLMLVAVGAVIVLRRFEIMSAPMAVIAGIGIFYALYILRNQWRLSAEIKHIKSRTMNLDAYEAEVEKRLTEISNKLDIPTSNDALESNLQAHRQAIRAIEKRLDGIEAGKSPDDLDSASKEQTTAAASKIMPGRNALAATAFSANAKEIEAQKKASLKTALSEQSLSMHLQPIVDLETRQPLYFDAFMRLKSGSQTFLNQDDFTKIAAEGRLTATIDKKVIFSSVRMLRKLLKLKKRTGVFCRISATTLSNTRTFDEIKNFLASNEGLRNALVVELTQREFSTLKPKSKERLGEIADLGIALCLTEVLDLGLNVQDLSGFGIRFMKVPVTVLVHANISDEQNGLHPSTLNSVLNECEIKLIATEVERDTDAVSLIDLDVELAQGLLFAPPRPVKAELLEPSTPVKSPKKQKTIA